MVRKGPLNRTSLLNWFDFGLFHFLMLSVEHQSKILLHKGVQSAQYDINSSFCLLPVSYIKLVKSFYSHFLALIILINKKYENQIWHEQRKHNFWWMNAVTRTGSQKYGYVWIGIRFFFIISYKNWTCQGTKDRCQRVCISKNDMNKSSIVSRYNLRKPFNAYVINVYDALRHTFEGSIVQVSTESPEII